jgi:hypothetical protein
VIGIDRVRRAGKLVMAELTTETEPEAVAQKAHSEFHFSCLGHAAI